MKEADRILLIKLAGIGDFILATPTLKALASIPTRERALLTSGRLKGLAERCPYVTSVYFLREPFGALRHWFPNLKTLCELRSHRFDLAINLHAIASWPGVLKMWFVMAVIGAKRSAGFASKGKGFFLKEKIADPPGGIQETEKHLALARHFGVVRLPEAVPEVWGSDQEGPQLENLFQRFGITREDHFLVGLHPGGNKPEFLWPAGHFAALAKYLYTRHGAKILLTGDAKERPLAEQVSRLAGVPAAVLCGELPLSLIPAFLKRLRLFVSNDTGLAHIAGAVGIPSVTLFGPRSRSAFAPIHRTGKGLILRKEGIVDFAQLSAQEVIGQLEPFLSKESEAQSNQRRLRIAHVITRLDPGGSSENTLLTLKGLDPTRYTLTLIYGKTEDPPGEILRELEVRGAEVVFLKELVRAVRPYDDLVALAKLYGLFRQKKFDIVHTHSSKAGVLGRLAAHWAGVRRIVHTPHGHVFYGYFNPCVTWMFIQVERWLGRITDRLITLTERGRQEHVAYRILPPDRIVPIHSGIQLEKFEEEGILAPEFSQWGPGPFVAMVGRLVPIKGHCYLLDAIPKVLQELPTARFLLVGEGPLRENLEARTRSLGISHAVFFLGECREVGPFLRGATLVVLTSLNEGMGRVLLEAQAMGKPVIGTQVGGIPDVIKEGETGLLVPPQDPQALSAALLSLLKDPKRCQKMGRAAKSWMGKAFGAEEMVVRISKLYEELLQTS